MPASRDPDLELLERWRGGDDQAGQRLFDRHFTAVKRFFRNKVSVGAEDLVQQTFLTCVETKETVRGEASYRTFLFGVAHNILRNHLRSKRRKQDPIDFGTVSAAALDPTPSRWVAKRQEQQLILLALRRVPLQFQIVLELYYWEGFDRNAIAAALDIPPGTAASRLRRGRELLRVALADVAPTPEVLNQTASNLDDWARQLAQQVQAERQAP